MTDDRFRDFEERDRRRNENATPPPSADEQRSERFSWLDDQLRPIGNRGGHDWLSTEPPKREYLLTTKKDGTGVLPAGRVAVLASAGGVGKSHALCQLAVGIAVADASETRWLGQERGFHIEKAGRVLLVMGEEEDVEIRRRLYYSARMMGLLAVDERKQTSPHNRRRQQLVTDRVVALSLAGRSGLALTRDLAKGEEGSGRTDFASIFQDRLRAMATQKDAEGKEHPWACIIIDPLARFAGGDVEKDNAAATRLIQVLEEFTHLPGNPTVIVAHHTRKAKKGEDGEVTADDVRGASALKDGARFVAVLEDQDRADDENVERFVKFSIAKNNYGTFPPELFLVRDSVNHGALREPRGNEYKDWRAALAKDDVGKPRKKKAEEERQAAPVIDFKGVI